MQIRDLIQVKPQPTVVRLDHLEGEGAHWVQESYYITEEAENHLKSLRHLMERDEGAGVFLIGHYGSGKSHFLAFLIQHIRDGRFLPVPPRVVPISLVNYNADHTLEHIILSVLGVSESAVDRRVAWSGLDAPSGMLLVLDELSEFLRSKKSARAFNEDIRFLQFLGEWSQDHRLWVLAALQEQIEHTGDMEYDLYRKIKDRYPIRMILSTTHVKNLIAHKILQKQAGYQPAVEKLAKQLRAAFPDNPMDYGEFSEIYPIHPVTLELLEEVRDRFSQARGIIDFTLNRLLGNPARGIQEPFLDRPWGSLLSPDTIVEHFTDLFEVQPEFLPLAQKVLPYFRKQIPNLFKTEAQQALAQRLLHVLILVHLSPARSRLTVEEAAWWLLFKVTTINPQKNLEVIGRLFDTMAGQGAFLKKDDSGYYLDLEDDSRETLDQLLERTMAELKDRGEAVLEQLAGLLDRNGFNPFTLTREKWQKRLVRWHFHDFELYIWLGGGKADVPDGIGLQIGLPWGPPVDTPGCYRLQPKLIAPNRELRELAALYQLAEKPLTPQVMARVEEKILTRAPLFATMVRGAYMEAVFTRPDAGRVPLQLPGQPQTLKEWLQRIGELIYRQAYPRFEDFAPSHGPLPKEAYRQLMTFAADEDLESENAPEYVKLIREAYLVPMRLMERKGRDYRFSSKLDQNELVTLLTPLLDHQPLPKRVFQHLSGKPYGLVPDQIQLLLLVLMFQGEIDILKGRGSYRELYETLPNLLQYDRIVPGKALSLNQLRDLQTICEGLRLAAPKQWNVLGQRRCAAQLQAFARRQRDVLTAFLGKLRASGQSEALGDKVERQIKQWAGLEKGENELQAVQHFLFEIGNPNRFLSLHQELVDLPMRFENLLSELHRYQHLLDAEILEKIPDMAVAVEALETPPELSEPDALEGWLQNARGVHERFKAQYRDLHDTYWSVINQHPVWSFRLPAVCQGRHLGLGEKAEQFEHKRMRLRERRCSGLSGLDFSPICRCGFDGAESPMDPELDALNELKREIEAELTVFFGQDNMREQVRKWAEQGVENGGGFIPYLEGREPYPDIREVNLFDRQLTGLDLFREVDTGKVLALLHERAWDRNRLIKAFSEMLTPYGERISFSKIESNTRPEGGELLTWCARLALQLGESIPNGFSRDALQALADGIDPKWVSERALKRLTSLGLGRAAEDRILKWLLDGMLAVTGSIGLGRLPDDWLGDEVDVNVAAALMMLHPPTVEGPEQLARFIARAYRADARLRDLAGLTWRDYLNSLAETPLTPEPGPLMEVLKANTADQWLVLDCFGPALLPFLSTVISELFPAWRRDSIGFARVSRQTTTDGFYQELVDLNPGKAFMKINCLDELIHHHRGPFADLEQRAGVELAVARKQLKDLDQAQPLLIFADHGFRLARDGSGYEHGGAATLERIVPVIRLEPYR